MGALFFYSLMGIAMRLLSTALALAISSVALAAVPDQKPHLHNSAMAFAEFWDANKDKPAAEQLAAFRAQVAPTYPGFYDVRRFKGQLTPLQYDQRIEGAIRDFPAIRTDYLRKAREFSGQLPGYMATFKAAFPDFQPPEDIYVLHALGEMDGGMREIGGKPVMIFGVDGMVKYHGKGKESAFFHHELFHVYHRPLMQECEDAGIWAHLWKEGLAVHVSKVLNPDADEQELLLDVPNHMAAQTRAVLPAALAQLESVLDNTDDETYASLFYGSGNAGTLPKRRGYYLGYLVAQDAGKTRDLRELARLSCAQVKELVHATVGRLRTHAN
jgi:hypothetical protein